MSAEMLGNPVDFAKFLQNAVNQVAEQAVAFANVVMNPGKVDWSGASGEVTSAAADDFMEYSKYKFDWKTVKHHKISSAIVVAGKFSVVDDKSLAKLGAVPQAMRAPKKEGQTDLAYFKDMYVQQREYVFKQSSAYQKAEVLGKELRAVTTQLAPIQRKIDTARKQEQAAEKELQDLQDNDDFKKLNADIANLKAKKKLTSASRKKLAKLESTLSGFEPAIEKARENADKAKEHTAELQATAVEWETRLQAFEQKFHKKYKNQSFVIDPTTIALRKLRTEVYKEISDIEGKLSVTPNTIDQWKQKVASVHTAPVMKSPQKPVLFWPYDVEYDVAQIDEGNVNERIASMKAQIGIMFNTEAKKLYDQLLSLNTDYANKTEALEAELIKARTDVQHAKTQVELEIAQQIHESNREAHEKSTKKLEEAQQLERRKSSDLLKLKTQSEPIQKALDDTKDAAISEKTTLTEAEIWQQQMEEATKLLTAAGYDPSKTIPALITDLVKARKAAEDNLEKKSKEIGEKLKDLKIIRNFKVYGQTSYAEFDIKLGIANNAKIDCGIRSANNDLMDHGMQISFTANVETVTGFKDLHWGTQVSGSVRFDTAGNGSGIGQVGSFFNGHHD
jgi:hypothetical protein